MAADTTGAAPLDPTLEGELAALFAVAPSPAVLGRLNDEARERRRRWDAGAIGRRRARIGRRAVVAALAAVFLLTGATGNLQSLYFLMAGPFDTPWHRGVEVGQSQVVDGYRVTIDRAYADATRLALAITVVDEEQRPGTTQLSAMATVVTDEDGEYGGITASSRGDGPFAAVNVAWKTPSLLPLPSGPRSLHVVVPSILVRSDETPPPNADEIEWNPWREHAGPWVFDFEIDVNGGTTLRPDAVATIDGASIRLSRLIVTSDNVRAELAVEGLDGSWSPVGVGWIEHDGRRLPFVVGSHEPDGRTVLMTDGGFGDTSGTWSVTIDRILGETGEREGPWELEFRTP